MTAQAEVQETPADDESARGNGAVISGQTPSSRISSSNAEEPPPAPKPKKPLYKRPVVMLILAAVVIGAAVWGVLYYLHARQFESTDDAFIAADITQVSPKIADRVTKVLVNDNQEVEKGQLLVVIDDLDAQATLSQAQASLVSAQGQVSAAQAKLEVAQAGVGQAQAQLVVARTDAANAASDLKRYQAAGAGAVSQQQLDNARKRAQASQAQVQAAQQAAAAAKAQVDSAQAQIEVARSQVALAKVKVHEAQLTLSYTKINAPVAGRITHKSVQVGDYVDVGQALMAIVPREVWVKANFKETQLSQMRPGQPVDITVDAYPDHTFKGRVDSIQAGTGSAFSLLPPENATGNYVKVVQRVPVKIVFENAPWKNYLFGPGMSVVPEVKITVDSGLPRTATLSTTKP